MLQNLKSILIGLIQEGDPDQAGSALPYGLSLARAADAHVTVESASLKLVMTGAFIGGVAAHLVLTENRRLDALAQAVAENALRAASACGLSCTTQAPQLSYPKLIESFTDLARSHDLTILDAEPVALAAERGLIEAILTQSGRPLIVVPKAHETFAGQRIVVAWDGGGKAARALNDALPFLRAAEIVELVSVIGEKDLADSVPGAEAAAHLSRHGVPVSVLTLPVVDGNVAETLRNHAHLTRADMIVMGAFMHSRFREMVLGGTTQGMLKTCPVPLMLSY
ncbi:universal stress protein [Microvirga antarctica]|uniref:universal stress protein n=1 Tax=Microvirga antarctica TaxID=2819233 RepID=UPI001B315500|nr:universal stress protein [Microvirga antarctica]